jgi:hypothetical protein
MAFDLKVGGAISSIIRLTHPPTHYTILGENHPRLNYASSAGDLHVMSLHCTCTYTYMCTLIGKPYLSRLVPVVLWRRMQRRFCWRSTSPEQLES